jgi:hypothetical protein
VQQVQALQTINLVSSRPEWMNWTIGIEKGIWGFIAGIGIGFAEAAVDMVTGIWDMISGIISGKLFTDMIEMVGDLYEKGLEGVWDMVKGMWTQGEESFKAAWNNPNPEEKWKFFGKIVGMILFEVVLAILTAGVGAAVSAAAKTSVLVAKLPKLVKVIDALTPDLKKVPDVDRDRLVKKGELDADKKLTKSPGDKVPDLNKEGPDYAKNQDTNAKKNAEIDAEKTIDKNDKDFASKAAALAQAILITNAADVIDLSPKALVADLEYLKTFKGVRDFSFSPVHSNDGNYMIEMLGSLYIIKPRYTFRSGTTITLRLSYLMREKILWGINAPPPPNKLIGGHFRGIIGHPEYVTEIVSSSSFNPGVVQVKFTKSLPGNRLSKLKTSTLFLSGWSKGKISDAIEEVANNPAKTKVVANRKIHQSQIDGVWVEVIEEAGEITAGYPLLNVTELIP